MNFFVQVASGEGNTSKMSQANKHREADPAMNPKFLQNENIWQILSYDLVHGVSILIQYQVE
jgi:hypothetical protein